MLCKLLSVMTSGAVCATAVAGSIEVGADLPDVSCVDQNGQEVSLADFAKTDWVLVYFYPKADTPGCTKQACSLRDSYEVITEQGVRVFGVSTDTVAEQKAFADKYQLPFTLLADKEAKVVEAFRVPKVPVVGLAKRQAFLFKQGKLMWKDESASTAQQADDVLKFIQK